MAQTTFANKRGIVHTKSGGQSVAFPDVCLTKVGKPIVPIPYANIGSASDTSQGPTSVKTDGQMPMVKDALYSRSTGDEAGEHGGINSGTHMGTCKFLTYSFDVKFEGRGVCRVGDSLLHNDQNTAGGIQTGEQILAVNTNVSTCEAEQNCQCAGDPIDTATGKAYTKAVILTCARPYLFSLVRTWMSTIKEIPGLFGLGWSSALDTRVELFEGQIHYYDEECLCHIFILDAKGTGTSFGKEVVVHDQQVEVTDRGGRTFHFAIDPESGDSRLEWITRNGIDLIYLQYENETLCALKDAAGYTYRFIRDHHNRVVAVERQIPGENRARLPAFDYDARNRLIEARDPMSHITTYDYNDADLMVRETDPGSFSFY